MQASLSTLQDRDGSDGAKGQMDKRIVEIASVAGRRFALVSAEARASYCTNTSLATLTSTPYAAHWVACDGVRCQRQRSPTAWFRSFDAAATGQTLIVQDALLEMNAHSDYDLGFSLERVNCHEALDSLNSRERGG